MFTWLYRHGFRTLKKQNMWEKTRVILAGFPKSVGDAEERHE